MKTELSSYQKWYYKNREKVLEDKRRYHQENRDKILTRQREYKKEHIEEARLHRALSSKQKVGSAIRDLGCTAEELKIYLESKFQGGMSWENRTLWHIDHIIPLSSFNLNDKEEFKKACHYSNLQPLWAEDNLKKGNREALPKVNVPNNDYDPIESQDSRTGQDRLELPSQV